MKFRARLDELAWRLRLAPARRRLRLFWYRADWEGMAFALFAGVMLTGFAFAVDATLAYQDARRDEALQARSQQLSCLARNVYFEARGEPKAGQYAVAEVTMNRKAAQSYPASVCEVVHQKNWDAIRKRYVAAFSWTEIDDLPRPSGDEWAQAQEGARDVYDGERPEKLDGALYYHSTRIKPSWAREKKVVARIGNHEFYK
jgi:spore germination cell wall hydrolase CwlJ-like protein